MISPRTTHITFIRHGDVYNPDDVIYGRLPGFPLSDVGREQIATTAQALARGPRPRPDVLYTSPQLRAQQSAGIIQEAFPDLEIITMPLIDEIDVYFEGHPAKELASRGWNLYAGFEQSEEDAHRYDTPADIAARGARFVIQMRDDHPGQHVLAVTHGDVIAFTVLWAMHEPVVVKLKRTLNRFGVHDRYPATASLTSLIYSTTDPDEVPDLRYTRPYGRDLVRPSLS